MLGRDIEVVTLTQLVHLTRAAGRPKDLEVIAELGALAEEQPRAGSHAAFEDWWIAVRPGRADASREPARLEKAGAPSPVVVEGRTNRDDVPVVRRGRHVERYSDSRGSAGTPSALDCSAPWLRSSPASEPS